MVGRTRSARGVVFPSPVVMLSIIAVAMAGIAFFATRSAEPTEREVTAVAQDPAASASASASSEPAEKKRKPQKPAVERGDVYVEVFNNSGITGLADRVSGSATEAGWQVVGADNWYGTIPATTVYHPRRLADAAELLALDLGIERTAIAVAPMKFDRLTVIMTGELG